MEEELIKELMKIFDCDKGYAHKIRISIKEDFPIQGSKPSQMFAVQNFILSQQNVLKKAVCSHEWVESAAGFTKCYYCGKYDS